MRAARGVQPVLHGPFGRRRWSSTSPGSFIAPGRAFCKLGAAARPSPLFIPLILLISNTHTSHPAIAIGKFLVSSLSKPLDDGSYCASVSIRSGRGSASTDRVMRFSDRFDSERAAHLYAHAQGRAWVAQTVR